jgi:hypothetical protein
MTPLRFVRWTIVLVVLLAAGAPLAADAEAEVPGLPQEYFSYPLRAGESLGDVARIFQVSVQELVEINHIEDPNRVDLGRTLLIPNVFARESAALRAERDRLLDLKRRAESESIERRQAAERVEAELRKVGVEKEALGRKLAGTIQWRKRAMVLALLLVAAVGWALKSRFDRALMARRQRALVTENSALRAAKDRLGQAAVQLELRYQQLYGPKREPPSYAVADGWEQLRCAFSEGVAEIEGLLAQLRSEQEKQPRLFRTGTKARSWLFHPVRGLLERRRLKYHAP